jgi:hypothetical protein
VYLKDRSRAFLQTVLLKRIDCKCRFVIVIVKNDFCASIFLILKHWVIRKKHCINERRLANVEAEFVRRKIRVFAAEKNGANQGLPDGIF